MHFDINKPGIKLLKKEHNHISFNHSSSSSSTSSSVVFWCTAGSWLDILPLYLYPFLSSAAHSSAAQPSFAKSCSIWILVFVRLPLILPSTISYKVCHVSKHGQSIDVSFAKYISVLSSFTLLKTSSLVTLSSQLIFPFSISTFQRL